MKPIHVAILLFYCAISRCSESYKHCEIQELVVNVHELEQDLKTIFKGILSDYCGIIRVQVCKTSFIHTFSKEEANATVPNTFPSMSKLTLIAIMLLVTPVNISR